MRFRSGQFKLILVPPSINIKFRVALLTWVRKKRVVIPRNWRPVFRLKLSRRRPVLIIPAFRGPSTVVKFKIRFANIPLTFVLISRSMTVIRKKLLLKFLSRRPRRWGSSILTIL